MVRLFALPGLLGGALALLWLWALLDVILTDSLLIRNMHKSTWIFLLIVLPPIAAILWLAFGRPEEASWAPGGQMRYESNPYRSVASDDDHRRRAARRPVAPEDRADWAASTAPSRPGTASEDSLAIRERKLMEAEADLARRRQELEEAATEASSDDSDGPVTS